MAFRSRVPGNIAVTQTGRRRHVYSGWRTFSVLDPNATVNDPNSQCSESSTGDGLTMTADGNVQFTLKDALTGQTAIQNMCCVSIPLTNKFGEAVTFLDAFTLKTQIEFISVSGDYAAATGNTNLHQPLFGFALGQNQSDIDGSSNANKFLGRGLLFDQQSGGVPKFKTYYGRSYQSAGSQQNDSSALKTTTKHLISNWQVGPAVGTANAEGNSARINSWAGQNASGSYAKNTQVGVWGLTINQDAAVFNTDGQVYLFAWFGSICDTDGSNDPAVVTCKMRYMCDSNLGKGGSGIT